jgi:uncharacterized protein (TIGR03083 family)
MTEVTPPSAHDFVASIRGDGALMAAAVAGIDPGAVVPTCPEWTVRDLARHMGGVHRWAEKIVSTPLLEPVQMAEIVEGGGGWPDDADLARWLEAGANALADTLAAAPDTLECFTFGAAPTPRTFWLRRQTHETAIHRVDAEAAVGTVNPVPPIIAVDGIDEVLVAFASRSRRLRGEPATLDVVPQDQPRRWRVKMDADAVRVVAAAGDTEGPDVGAEGTGEDNARCTISGRASDLYLLLWNRQDAGPITVSGDAGVVTRWNERMQVRMR